jgi:PAS domain S-box-containing protein
MSAERDLHGEFTYLQRAFAQAPGRDFRVAALHLLEDVADARRKSAREFAERRLAEDKVRESEERYHTLFTQMDQGLGIAEIEFEDGVAVDLRWLDVNQQFADATGIARTAIAGHSLREIAPGLEPEWLEIFSEVARSGKSVRFERRSDALGRWLAVNAFRLGDPSKHQVVVLVTDTTERARQVAELAFLAAVADDCSRLSSVDSIVRVVSDRIAQHMGVEGCKLVEETSHAPDDAGLNEGRLVVPLGRVGERRVGLEVLTARPRTWTREEIASIEAAARQMHPALQRAAAEDALRASRERLRLIVDNARDYAILTLEPDRRVSSFNPGAERLTGHAAADIVGRSGDILFTPEDRAAGAPEREAQTAIAVGRATDERWHVRRDGTRFWGSGSMLAMRDEAGRAIGLLKIFRDQTAELLAREELENSRRELWLALQETERARKDAEAAGRAKDQVFAVLSHELRTPLTPILFGTEALLLRDDLAPAVRDVLAMIQRNVEMEARLVDDLLDVTRMRHGKIELALSPMDIHDAVSEAVEVARPDIETRGQRLVVALDARHGRVTGDPARLQQVVWNVLKNASKFTPGGGEIRVATHDEPGHVVIEVTDDGIGIDPSMLSTIFDPFTQAENTVTRSYGGLGLGLAIAKGIVERHGGRMEAHSPGAGQGATFTIVLPTVIEARGEREVPA